MPIASYLDSYMHAYLTCYAYSPMPDYIRILYSGYNLQGIIFANHQISHLAVIFAIIKLANHCIYHVFFCVARSIYVHVLVAYQYFEYTQAPAVSLYSGVIESEAMVYSQFNGLPHSQGDVIGEVLVCCCDTQNCHDDDMILLLLLHVKARHVVGHI